MITIATRKSKLAIIQSEMIKAALRKAGASEVDLLPLSTTGDDNKDRALLEIGGKGLFTKEIEEAVLEGHAQIAMHSLKDMPVHMPDGLILAGVLPRDIPYDLLVCHYPVQSLDDLPEGTKIGTSSPRRTAQLQAMRPDFTIMPFRGNVPTRLQKIEHGEVDATILAAAGLKRLGLGPKFALPLPSLPAIGQGTIAIQCREDDTATCDWIARINDTETMTRTLAERAVLQAVEGDCHTPLAAHAIIKGQELIIEAEVLSVDGQTRHYARQTGSMDDAAMLGKACGEELLPKAKELWQSSC